MEPIYRINDDDLTVEQKQDIAYMIADGVLEAVEESEPDLEAAGWAYWNEERVGSTSPDSPPFDDYDKYAGIWVARAKIVVDAAYQTKETL